MINSEAERIATESVQRAEAQGPSEVTDGEESETEAETDSDPDETDTDSVGTEEYEATTGTPIAAEGYKRAEGKRAEGKRAENPYSKGGKKTLSREATINVKCDGLASDTTETVIAQEGHPDMPTTLTLPYAGSKALLRIGGKVGDVRTQEGHPQSEKYESIQGVLSREVRLGSKRL